MVIKRHTELHVYKRSFDAAMRVFEITKTFPKEERSSLVDQIRRSSRSVCANLTEAWRKQRYQAAYISKLSDARPKLRKHRSGFNSRLNANNSTAISPNRFTQSTPKSSLCSFT